MTTNFRVPPPVNPVTITGFDYETVAASQSKQAIGGTGAAGDYLHGVLIVPAAAAAGVVNINDGGGSTEITVFEGGGTVALPSLMPVFVPLGLYSKVGGWTVTTGANVSVIAVGSFTP